MSNKKSNAPGFGNGNGTLKQPTFPSKRKMIQDIPGPGPGPERGNSISKQGLSRRGR